MTESVYHLISGDRKYGRFTEDELAVMLEKGEISLDTLCICQGDGGVQEIGELFEFDEPMGDEPSDDEELDEDEEEEALFEEIPWEEGIWYADEDEDQDDDDHDERSVERASSRAKPEMDLDDIILHLHPSILGYPKMLLTSVAFLLGSTGILFVGPLVGLPGETFWLLGLSAAAGVFALLLFLRYFDNYYVTRARAEVVRGDIAKSSNEVRMSDIRRIDVDKKGLLGLLNVGDVKLSSAGTGGFDVVFANVRAGHHIKKVLRRVQKEPQASKRFLRHGKSWLRRR